MTTSNETTLRKIERASSVLRAVTTAVHVPVVILGIVATVAILSGSSAHISYLGQDFVPSELLLEPRLVLAVVVVATALVMLKALRHLRQLAGNYMRREIFTADSARQIRQFGLSCVLWGLIKLAWAFLPLLILAKHGPVYTAASDSILMGAVIIGISWFAEMAAALREENDLTV